MTGSGLVLYAIGSPVVVDVEESLSRAGIPVVAAVRNVDAPAWLMGDHVLVERSELGADLMSHPFLVPLFAPGNRQMAADEARTLGFDDAFTLTDPTTVTPTVWTPGAGSYVNAGCTIGAGARFGEFVFVNRGASIGHHAVLDKFVSVGPGAVLCGQVQVGKGTLIGAGVVVLPQVRIGANAVVRAGSLVARDVPDHTLVGGNPLRVLKTEIAGYRDLTVA